MKYLIMCEGPNEKKIIEILLEHDCLILTRNDLLGLVPYFARQIKKSTQVQLQLDMYPGEVKVLRIGDKLNDVLAIPPKYRSKIVSVEKYCTKPELEMLLIISEGLQKEFEKEKSTITPKSFAKDRIRLGKRKYKNDTEFYNLYYGSRPDVLVTAIEKYRQIKKSHKKDENYLADLIK